MKAQPRSWRVSYTAKPAAALYQNLKYLIAFILIIICFIPGLVALAGMYQTSKNAFIEAKGLYFSQVASIASTETAKIIEEKLDSIGRLASLSATKNVIQSHPRIASIEAEKLKMMISPEVAKEGNLVNVYDSDGSLVFTSDESINSSFKKGAIVEIINTGQEYVSDVASLKSPNGRHFYIDIYAPVAGDFGDTIGSIHARYQIDTLFDVVQRVKFGHTGIALLVNSGGDVIMCPACQPGSFKLSDSVLSSLSAGKTGWNLVDNDGFAKGDSVIGFSPINVKNGNLNPASFGKKRWYLVVRQSPSETFDSLSEFRKVIIGYCAAVIVCAIALASIAFKWILKAQKNYHEELLRKERSESTRQLLSLFHERLLSPLDEFGKWTDEAALENGGKARREGELKLKKIRNQIQEMNSLIDHLGYYTHLKDVPLAPVDLTGIVDDSVAMFDYLFSKNGVTPKIQKPEDPVMLMGHSKLLSFVVMNLILNSLHSVENGGEIRLWVEKIQSKAIFRIFNNGNGLSKDELHSWFDPLYGINNREKGTIPGLAVSREIVEDHKGEMTINSTKGKGTEVTVKFNVIEAV